jgi:glycosyltransferase involved in cell wall biosynthesis
MTVEGRKPQQPLRVLHFVTGGMSGATQVAIDLVQASRTNPAIEPLLVLRHKRQTALSTYDALKSQGVPLELVSGALHVLSIWQLARICKRVQPDVLVAHGFPEHILGRHAGLIAGVPRLIHVEHNSRERYSASRLRQAKWLAQRTESIVGVSQGVKAQLLKLGFPSEHVRCIPNGIDLARFGADAEVPAAQRQADIVMCARFSSQKDHLTAIRAMAVLRDQGFTNRLLLAGDGKARHRAKAQRLATELRLGEQVIFMGRCSDVPALLMASRIGLLSTHYEGMPLAMLEAMAAGCAVVASDVVGVREVLSHGATGLLVPENDARVLAKLLVQLLQDNEQSNRLGRAARQQALQAHGLPLMRQRYEDLLLSRRPAA